MSMNQPWILYITSDPPDQGSVYRLALERLGEAVQKAGNRGRQGAFLRGRPDRGARLGVLLGGGDRLGPGRNRRDERRPRPGHHPRHPGKVPAHPDFPADTRHQHTRPAVGRRQRGARVHQSRRRDAGIFCPAHAVRHRRLPRRAAAALLQGAQATDRGRRLSMGCARTHGRRRLSQASCRRGIPPFLR